MVWVRAVVLLCCLSVAIKISDVVESELVNLGTLCRPLSLHIPRVDKCVGDAEVTPLPMSFFTSLLKSAVLC